MAKIKLSDKELMNIIGVNSETLKRFKEIREETIKEATMLQTKMMKRKKIKVLGISGSARDRYDKAQESSNSEELLEKCLKYCEELGAETELIKLRNYDIRYCKACYSTANTQCHFYCSCYPKGTRQGDDMSNILYDKIIEADVIIFATPTNNFKISTLMATFIDRCISLDGSLKPADPKYPKNKTLNIKHMKFIELTADPDVPGSGMLRRFQGKVAGIITTGHEEGASMAISSLFMTLNHFGMIFPPFSTVYAVASICNSTYKDKSILVKHGCYDDELKALANNVLRAAKLVKKSKTTWSYDPRTN
jgi:multimeric flavodoxin WrbA